MHIYLKTKEIYLGKNLLRTFVSSPILANTHSKDLIEHIGNCLDHCKMLPIYLSLGFNKEKFICDYRIPKCSSEEINTIKKFFNCPRYWHLATDSYLGKFFGIMACPNDQINYSQFLKGLKTLDPQLFNILFKFWNTWNTFDINKNNSGFNNYCKINNEFINNLIEWTTIKSNIEN